jgi:hypothetical protein
LQEALVGSRLDAAGGRFEEGEQRRGKAAQEADLPPERCADLCKTVVEALLEVGFLPGGDALSVSYLKQTSH